MDKCYNRNHDEDKNIRYQTVNKTSLPTKGSYPMNDLNNDI